ncbi:hypothetical protein ED28_07400 [[Pantoea] beijingensis]|uniref:Thiol:disulfide interchange protein n=1 Tax=[Pantoea] beijingensis TaxID=1324864 RepID=A0A443IES2_9GAMM|nr:MULTISPECIES: DsbA family protein [Erwiniaceae]RWR02567.1 hypothetical protein ED28_07400 [[Pantoea] beijingensis]
MKKISLSLACLFFLAQPSLANNPEQGKQYIVMNTPVTNAPMVVEFFSFYCPPCRKFMEDYRVGDSVDKVLPNNTRTDKIHVSEMGPLGRALTEAWSAAKLLGVENQVQGPLFAALQDSHTVNNASDIRQVFVNAGISAKSYDAAINSFAVKNLTLKQIQAVKDFGVTGTPAVFVNGRYMVRLNGFNSTSPQGYAMDFASTVQYLIVKK